ncbi:hypothetical protein LSH36_3595g00002, partial [Paralvinella palmiformis]
TRTKKLHKIPANTFILSLAFADGMVGVLSPAIVLTAITNEQHIWMSAVCLFRGPYYAMFSTSLVTLLAIAIDRGKWSSRNSSGHISREYFRCSYSS